MCEPPLFKFRQSFVCEQLGFEFSLKHGVLRINAGFNLQANFCLYKPLPFATH